MPTLCSLQPNIQLNASPPTLQVTLAVPPEAYEGYIAGPLRALYLIGADPHTNTDLAQMRTDVLNNALSKSLLPHALMALRGELAAAARGELAREVEDAFWREATTPPLRLKVPYVGEEVRAFTTPLVVPPLFSGWLWYRGVHRATLHS